MSLRYNCSSIPSPRVHSVLRSGLSTTKKLEADIAVQREGGTEKDLDLSIAILYTFYILQDLDSILGTGG